MTLFNNLSVLNLTALIGLASLLIPVLIHLFNPSRGKLVLIGNIDLIKKVKNIRIIEIKINQWLLLFIRLAIFTLITLLLADLVNQDKQEYSKQTNVFLSPDWLNQASEKELDELQKRHAEDRLFTLAPGFDELSLPSLDSPSKETSSFNISIDALLAELSQRQLLSEKNIIYTTNRVNHYSSLRTKNLSNERIEWRVKTLNDAVAQSPVLNISVFYSPSRLIDYQNLQLAFDTLSGVSKTKLNVSYFPTSMLDLHNAHEPQLDAKMDWIFWLSEKKLPEELDQKMKQGSFLFEDLQGDLSLSKGGKLNPIAISIPIQIEQSWISFYSENLSPLQSNFKPIWFNKAGQVILSSKDNQQGKVFRFNSRFHPDWSDLLQTIQFPVVLSRLLFESPSLAGQRQVSPLQLTSLPAKSVINSNKKMELEARLTTLRPVLLLVLCVFWLIERYLSEKQPSKRQGLADGG